MGLIKNRKPNNILGTQHIYTDELMNYFIPKVTTTFFRPDSDILAKLVYLGFEILKTTKTSLTVRMPIFWTHFTYSDTEDYIIDHLCRIRIIINKKTHKVELKRRFNYSIDMIETPQGNNMQCSITDCGVVATGLYIDPQLYNQMLSEGNDSDKILEICRGECENALDSNFPEWRDETKYWEI